MNVNKWNEKLRSLLDEARAEMAKYDPKRRGDELRYFYWQGYTEAIQRVLDGGPETFLGILAHVEEIEELHKSGPFHEATSPRQYTKGELEALHRVQGILLDEEGD